MPFREYMAKVHGYTKRIQDRRIETRLPLYYIYLTTHAALGSKVKPLTIEQFLPTGIKEEPEEKLEDPNGLVRKAFERLNPHLKGKHYANSRT